MGPKYLTGFLNAVWNNLRNVKWKYLGYAIAYVVLVWLSQLLVANPDSFLILVILASIGLGVGILIALKRKTWVKPYTTFLTWVAITLGSIVAGQLSRTTILLTQFVQYDWVLVIGLALLVGANCCHILSC
jgi:hypothetical protein